MHGTSSRWLRRCRVMAAGLCLSWWIRAMGAKRMLALPAYVSVFNCRKQVTIPLANCTGVPAAANPAAPEQLPGVIFCENEPLCCEDEEGNSSVESANSPSSMLLWLLPPVLSKEKP